MNNPRRKQLNNIVESLSELKEVLETLLSEEEEYRDNMPENLQGSERYEKADNACDSIQYAIDNIEDAVSNIEEATE